MYVSDTEKLQKNNMDLPDPRPHFFNGIRYELSSLFYSHYDDDYVISDNYDISRNAELQLYFSVEFFSKSDAEEFQFQFEEGDSISYLDAVHDHYAVKRNASLEEASVSIKKSVPESVGFPGVMQTISGSTYSSLTPNTYMFATLEIENEYVVVQLIGKKDNMGYLYDDFIDILSSISL